MYQFEVYGTPVAQKQTRATCKCGGVRMYDPSKADREKIQWQIKPFAPPRPLSCPVELTIAFFMPIPKATHRAMREQMVNRVIFPDKRPDEDNLAYIISNSLKGLVIDDDCRVVAKHVYKFYGEDPKTVIKVRPILEGQALGYRDADDDF